MKTFLFSWTKYGIAGNVKTSREYINEMKRHRKTQLEMLLSFSRKRHFSEMVYFTIHGWLMPLSSVSEESIEKIDSAEER